MTSLAYIVDPTLGHVVRAHEICRQLQNLADLDITIITPDERGYVRQFLEPHYPTHHVPMTGPDPLISTRFARGLDPILQDLSPDLILHDMCPLRYLSTAKLPPCPRVHITNAFLTHPAGFETFQVHWFKDIGPATNQERAKKQLSAITDPRHLYDADLVICADPNWVIDALPPLPGHYHPCGQIGIELDAPLPDVLKDARDLMILSMGSTGRTSFDADMITSLRHACGADYALYVGKPYENLPVDSIHEWLPLHRILDQARLVVTQGGTGSTYQALSFGCPVLTLPLHRNHEILSDILVATGAGVHWGDTCTLSDLDKIDFAALKQTAMGIAEQMQATQDGALSAARCITDRFLRP